MRKASTSLRTRPGKTEADLSDARPGRIQGATITSWTGPPEIDLGALFAKPAGDATVGGGGQRIEPIEAVQSGSGTVRLSDGTQITFATAGQFTVVETV
jgi:hypothetical protein